MVTIDKEMWQVVRAIWRQRGRMPGWKLRLTPTRRNKDGTFLFDMVKLGLIEPAGICGPPPQEVEIYPSVRQCFPFHVFYKLTEAGRYVADKGEVPPGYKKPESVVIPELPAKVVKEKKKKSKKS